MPNKKEMELAMENDTLIAILQEQGFTVDAVADTSFIKDFDKVDKEYLINVPFVIVEVLEKDSLQYGNKYVVCRAVDRDRNMIVFADGSDGVCAQIMELMTNYQHLRKPINVLDDGTGWSGWKYKVAIVVPHGLQKNEYDTKVKNNETGEIVPVHGTTFRLNFK